jgi:hypothetical protein
VDERPRHHAERIGKAMREKYKELIAEVPEEFRSMVTEYYVDSVSKGFHKAKAGRRG